MANASSRARAVYKQNTEVFYYEASDAEDTPVSTARIVSVGAAANAAPGGATLQLVGGSVAADGRQQMPGGRRNVQSEQPQVVQVEPPRAAPRKHPGMKGPTRVIAYNVRIVSEGDEQLTQVAYEERPGVEQNVAFDDTRVEMLDPQFVVPMPKQSHRHREMELEAPARAGRAPNHAPLNMPPQHARAPMPRGRAHNAQMRGPQPHAHDAAQFEMPRNARFDMPERDDMPAGTRAARGPMGSVPMSLFGALQDMGGKLHEQSRRAAGRAQAAAADGSYKQLLTQLEAGHGGLLSNRNMCMAVGAYAFVLFLLAVFTS